MVSRKLLATALSCPIWQARNQSDRWEIQLSVIVYSYEIGFAQSKQITRRKHAMLRILRLKKCRWDDTMEEKQCTPLPYWDGMEGYVREMCGCDTNRHGLAMGCSRLGLWLDFMILNIYSNLNNFMILWLNVNPADEKTFHPRKNTGQNIINVKIGFRMWRSHYNLSLGGYIFFHIKQNCPSKKSQPSNKLWQKLFAFGTHRKKSSLNVVLVKNFTHWLTFFLTFHLSGFMQWPLRSRQVQEEVEDLGW